MSTPINPAKAVRIAIAILLVGAAAGTGFAAGRLAAGPSRSLPLLSEALGLIEEQYLRPLPDRSNMERQAVRGLIQSLQDPYTILVDPVERELETDTLSGEYGGIGADIVRDAAAVVRLVPFPEGPAIRAGILEGDVLLAIDGVILSTQMSVDEITALLRGPEGSEVTLTVGQTPQDPEPRSLQLVRENFPLPSVASYLYPDDAAVGVVRIRLFTATTPAEVDEALHDLADRGAIGVVVDLRGNPGGLFESAVDTARLFLADGPIVAEVRVDGSGPSYKVEAAGRWSALPVALVVDGGTASAAELLAAVLQQHDRAALAGQATLGKGSVQSVFPLSDGSSLHLTTAVWQLPDGNELPLMGLSPDIPVTMDALDPDASLRTAAAWLRAQGGLP
jgi:carboxyl-terminal processing protease